MEEERVETDKRDLRFSTKSIQTIVALESKYRVLKVEDWGMCHSSTAESSCAFLTFLCASPTNGMEE